MVVNGECPRIVTIYSKELVWRSPDCVARWYTAYLHLDKPVYIFLTQCRVPSQTANRQSQSIVHHAVISFFFFFFLEIHGPS